MLPFWVIPRSSIPDPTIKWQVILIYTLFINLVHGSKKSKLLMALYLPLLEKGVFLSQKLSLDSTLHIPQLSCSLISISKITKYHNHVANFFPSYCEFQDLYTRKLIGVSKEIDGLYYFKNKLRSSGNLTQTHLSSSSFSSNQ